MRKIDSEKLLNLMLERGIDLCEAAKAAGVSATALSVAIRYGRQCRFSTIHKLARFFGVEPRELILDSKE